MKFKLRNCVRKRVNCIRKFYKACTVLYSSVTCIPVNVLIVATEFANYPYTVDWTASMTRHAHKTLI